MGCFLINNMKVQASSKFLQGEELAHLNVHLIFPIIVIFLIYLNVFSFKKIQRITILFIEILKSYGKLVVIMFCIIFLSVHVWASSDMQKVKVSQKKHF